jgi:hypothetical protein
MKKTWSRKKIDDEFTGMLKADGTPMSRQQVHMLRKKARGICMICSEPAVGVYCMKHTIAVRERMRKKLKYRRRLLNSASYATAKSGKKAIKAVAKAPVKAVKAVKTVAKKAPAKAVKSVSRSKSKK